MYLVQLDMDFGDTAHPYTEDAEEHLPESSTGPHLQKGKIFC